MFNLYNSMVLLEAAAQPEARILGFDMQTLVQTLFHIVAVLLLFYIIGRLVFKPVREILAKRKQEIADTYAKIEKETIEANVLKGKYEEKLKHIKAEETLILSKAHAKANARGEEIIKQAHKEAEAIMNRAHLEIEREREQLKDDIRNEIIQVATTMAGKIVQVSLSEEDQKVLINKTIDEMGEDTWSN